MSYKDPTTEEGILDVLQDVRDSELGQLLVDVHRIADGIDGFRQLCVELSPAPGAARSWVDLARARMALDAVESLLIEAAIVDEREVRVDAGTLAVVHRLAREWSRRR